MRLVSLTCSNTEIVCALGRGEWLVGVDDHSDYPLEVVARLPRVGPDLGVDVDAVAALAPDLVLASLTVPGHEAVVARLQRAGLPFIAPAPVSLADTYRDIRDIARRLGVEAEGERLVASMQAEIGRCREATGVRVAEERPPILVEWWPKPVFVPGGQSWVTDLLVEVGARNPFDDPDAKSLVVSDERVRLADPVAIVVAWCGVDPKKYRLDKVLGRPGWGTTTAVRERRVYAVAEAFLGRPGPRLTDGARALARIVRECSLGK